MKTPQQKENIREALRMWATVPPENVALGLQFYRKGPYPLDGPPTCKTVACFGGWLPYWPAFAKKGVVADIFGGAPEMRGLRFTSLVSHKLFGDDCAFDPRGAHVADVGFRGTDRALVINRLHWMLNHE